MRVSERPYLELLRIHIVVMLRNGHWIAGHVTDAFRWDEAPRHLIATVTAHSVQYTPAAFARWGFEITLSHRGRLKNGHVE